MGLICGIGGLSRKWPQAFLLCQLTIWDFCLGSSKKPLQDFKQDHEEIKFISSVQFSCSVVSDHLRPRESQHVRPPCPSPTPGVYSNSHPSSQWCHPAISSSVVPFSSCPQSLPASGSFPMSQLSAWGGQSIGVSASASVPPVNTQDWSLGWIGWIFLQFKWISSLLQHHNSEAPLFRCSASFTVQLSHPCLRSGPYGSHLEFGILGVEIRDNIL